jgi:16S rRNA (cytosine967-C5)-methyltransferase
MSRRTDRRSEVEPTRARVETAAAALQALLAFSGPADSVLKQFFREHKQLGQHDRAFVAELAFAVLRNLRLLEQLGAQRSARRLALASLSITFGISVRELAPLLRREEEAWLTELRSHPHSELPAAVRLSLPDWLFERLLHQYGADEMEPLARALLQQAPLDLRVNTLLASREEVLKQLAEDGIGAVATAYSPAGIRLESKPALQKHPLFLEGKIEVQDHGSQLLSYLLAPRRRQMVVDFCAGAGGKTLALGAMMSSEGRLYAFDTSDRRLANLKLRLKRSGLSNVHPQHIDSEADARIQRLDAKIDRVLVDAPCSGFGTLRRNPDLKWRHDADGIAQMMRKQEAILQAAARLVKPGGRMVYATCSLLREENEQIVEQFLARAPLFRLMPAREVLRSQGIELNTGDYFRVLPHTHGMDGFFAAVLERAG